MRLDIKNHGDKGVRSQLLGLYDHSLFFKTTTAHPKKTAAGIAPWPFLQAVASFVHPQVRFYPPRNQTWNLQKDGGFNGKINHV